MPRYVVERDFPDGLQIPIDETGAKACLAVVESNLADQVTWVHSYVSVDKKKTFCIYDGPSPGGDSPHRQPQQTSRRAHHRGLGPRPLLLQIALTHGLEHRENPRPSGQ